MQAANSLCSPPQPNPGLPGFGRFKCTNTDPHPARLPCASASDPPHKGEGRTEYMA
jgi:hypothetical protein